MGISVAVWVRIASFRSVQVQAGAGADGGRGAFKRSGVFEPGNGFFQVDGTCIICISAVDGQVGMPCVKNGVLIAFEVSRHDSKSHAIRIL